MFARGKAAACAMGTRYRWVYTYTNIMFACMAADHSVKPIFIIICKLRQGPPSEEVGHAHVSVFCIHSAHYLQLLKYTIFNCVL